MDEGIPRATIYRVIQVIEQRQSIVRRPGSGRPAKILTPTVLNDLKNRLNNNDDTSFREVAKELGCHHTHVSRTLKTKCGIQTRKKLRCPKYKDEQQIKEAKNKCLRLERQFRGKSVIQDDESWFPLEDNFNRTFKSLDPKNAPQNIRFSENEKYGPKVMVWIAGLERGLSEVFIKPAKLGMDSEIYQKYCSPKLKLFIDKYHSDDNYYFWPDKATCHYAKTTTAEFARLGIHFVAKQDNPTSVPQARPIEDFWAILKREVWATKNKPQNIDHLVDRIRYCVKHFDKELARKIFGSTKKRVRLCARENIFSAVH